MNCTIVIEQKEGDIVRQNIYQLDDYRVAQAVCNILDNIVDVVSQRSRYDSSHCEIRVRGTCNENKRL